MPDLTIEYHEMCSSIDREVRYNINGYEQTLYHGQREHDHCTCPAYKFSKKHTCKHLKEAYEQECGWHGAYDEEQTEKGVCPRCGGSTITVAVGV